MRGRADPRGLPPGALAVLAPAKVVLASGTLPIEMLGAHAWPTRTAVQIHYATGDPLRREPWLQSVIESVRAAGAPLEVSPNTRSPATCSPTRALPDYDQRASETFWQRTLVFLADEAATRHDEAP